MDIEQARLFIAFQFSRLGMYEPVESEMRLFFIKQLATRTHWWILCRVVEYVENKLEYYYD